MISVAVSARATDLTVGGATRQLSNPGDNFVSSGIPVGLLEVPISPETVIEQVATKFGKRVSQVPELVLPVRPSAPQLAKWHVTLESPVSVHSTESTLRNLSADVFYGFGKDWRSSGLLIGSNADAAEERLRDLSNGRPIPVTVTRRAGIPHNFEPAEPEAP